MPPMRLTCWGGWIVSYAGGAERRRQEFFGYGIEVTDMDPAPGTPEGDRLEILGLLVEAYEMGWASPMTYR